MRVKLIPQADSYAESVLLYSRRAVAEADSLFLLVRTPTITAMKLLCRLSLVCLASCCPLLAQAGADGTVQSSALKSRLAIESGNKLREQKEFSAALHAYRDALRLQPDNANAWFYLGITYVNLDRLEEARASFRRSVMAAAGDPAKWVGLCLSHYVLGDFGNAVHTCEEALRLDPRQAEPWAWMGLGYAQQQRWDKATPALEIAAALGTKSSEAWYTLGIRYARQAQRSRVLQVYRRLQELDPEQARKFFNAAVSRRARG
jgi:tetratricopeptide (TPR) repeat protein